MTNISTQFRYINGAKFCSESQYITKQNQDISSREVETLFMMVLTVDNQNQPKLKNRVDAFYFK